MTAYRVRIFEPKVELPFAGHPTLGACAAWLDAGGEPQRPGVVVQECGAGLIEIRQSRSGAFAFAAPPMTRHELRAFFNDPNGMIREDPVTGSLNASVAQWLLAKGVLHAPYVASQTTGRASVEQADGEIWVGGVVDVRVSGTIEL